MRTGPIKFDGLRLRLSSGWYSIPSYVSADERRRLCKVLAAGVAEIDHVVELDWDTLEEAGAQLQLTRTLVFVRVPAEIEPEGDGLQRVRAALGSVRLGLLQHEAPGLWADVAWQEREIKGPLLTWFKRWLRDPAHPFAKLGIADLPVDEIAKLTAEPAELLIIVEKVIDHRLRYRRQGMAPEDWIRSVMHVAAERLAGRLMQIPGGLLARALDVAASGAEDPLVPALEDYDAGIALAHVGLAWHGGNDLLLGPLVRLASKPVALRRLLELLPGSAWSVAGKLRVHRALRVFLPPPRAVLVAPEPAYSMLPVIEWETIIKSWLVTSFGANHDLTPWALGKLDAVLRRPTEHQLDLPLDWPECPPRWRAAFDDSLTMLAELYDDQLLELDLERGRIHRFDAMDRAWHSRRPNNGREARACFRWLGLTRLLDRIRNLHHLNVLVGELDVTYDLVDPSSSLAAALHGLKGDIFARQRRYRSALNAWTEAGRIATDTAATERLERRRSRALMRLDDPPGLDVGPSTAGDEIVSVLSSLLDVLRSVLAGNPQPGRLQTWNRWLAKEWWFNDDWTSTAVAAALECGDWVEAFKPFKPGPIVEKPTSIGNELLQAWFHAALGDLDRAHSSCEALLAQATAYNDPLDQAFAHRGLAAVAYLRDQTEPAIASLEAALALERDLELPDANLLELELTGWRVLAGHLPITEYSIKLAESERRDSPSYQLARLDSYLRFLASAHAVVAATEPADLIRALQPFIATLEECVPLREHSPWIEPAYQVAAGLADRLETSGMADDATKVRDILALISP